MNYVALYRKYRPDNFTGIVGQDHIVSTLVNQIINNKVSHAYLFCGTRGTGKTSIAKILAKAVNCLQPNQGNPCGICANCIALAHNNLDIIEMDAASNNSVDYARDIKEKAQYPPAVGKYKVYIIDEVHVLSQAAFNALLKTLEEPPSHAVFMLCTTDAHKLPATIISRCMRFDFKLIPTAKLVELISSVYDKEGKQYTRDAVYAIAQAGEGSARDSLSIADRCYSLSDGQLTYNDVMSVLGVTSRQSIAQLTDCVLRCDIENILIQLRALLDEGKEVSLLNRDIMQHLEHILIGKTVKNAREMLCLPDESYSAVANSGSYTTVNKLLFAIDTLSKLELDLKYAASPALLFEAVILRIAGSDGEVDYVGLDRRLTRLEQQANALTQDSLVIVDKNDAQSIWKGVLSQLKRLESPLLVTCWQEIKVAIESDNYVVSCKSPEYHLLKNEYMQQVLCIINKVCGKNLILKQVSEPKAVTDEDIIKQLGNNVTIK